MTPQLNYTNTAILGLIQIGVVVVGVIGAGVTAHRLGEFGIAIPAWSSTTAAYGWFALAIPVVWITTSMILQHRDEVSDFPEGLTYFSGYLVLLLLIVGAITAVLPPWIQLMNPCLTLST
jgi:hypothetical protein